MRLDAMLVHTTSAIPPRSLQAFVYLQTRRSRNTYDRCIHDGVLGVTPTFAHLLSRRTATVLVLRLKLIILTNTIISMIMLILEPQLLFALKYIYIIVAAV